MSAFLNSGFNGMNSHFILPYWYDLVTCLEYQHLMCMYVRMFIKNSYIIQVWIKVRIESWGQHMKLKSIIVQLKWFTNIFANKKIELEVYDFWICYEVLQLKICMKMVVSSYTNRAMSFDALMSCIISSVSRLAEGSNPRPTDLQPSVLLWS